jgi:muramoyltetrapeptide carboxypeptidase
VPALKKARAVRPGDRIGIAAPAGRVDPDRLEAGEQMLRRLGFEPTRRADLTDTRGYLAGDDERRATELMELILDPSVAAIICARGGYGSSRIIGRLDPVAVRKARKPLVGYSDITTLLLWQRRVAGLMGIHGPMLERRDPLAPEVATSLSRALTGTGPSTRLPGKSLAGGWAEGRLIGGSLSLVAASLGTPWEIDTRESILLIEDVGEPTYRIDRLLQQLLHAGKLDAAVGVGVGSTQDCEDDRYPDLGVEDVLREFLEPLGVPVITELPFGHGEDNLSWAVGGRAAIDGDRGEVELLEFAVAPR